MIESYVSLAYFVFVEKLSRKSTILGNWMNPYYYEKQDISLLKIVSVILYDVPRHTIKDTSPMVEYSEKANQLPKE